MPEIRASIARTREFLYFPPIQKPRKYPTIIAIAAPSRKNARACYAAPPASENARYADIERQQASRLPAFPCADIRHGCGVFLLRAMELLVFGRVC
jgi:hypothetical protein